MRGPKNKTGIKWRGEEGKLSRKKYFIKRKYNLDYSDYERMLKDQDGKCKICGEVKLLHIDHCHSTNKVRGLLCQECNLGLGLFKDNPNILSLAINYVKAFR